MDLSYLESLMGGEEAGPEYEHIWLVLEAGKEGGLGLAGKARTMADGLGAYVKVLVVGGGDEDYARKLIQAGADEVYLSANRPDADGLAGFFEERKPEMLIFVDSSWSKEVAPRLAFRWDTALVPHGEDLGIDEAERALLVTAPVYERLASQVYACSGHPQMATVSPKAFEAPFLDESREGTVESVDLPVDSSPVREVGPASERPERKLTVGTAKVVVSGGRGVRDDEGWELLAKLAEALGGVVGGSRGALDDGRITEEQFVDITGHRIAPDLYIACGISGTMYHYAGMKDAKMVVAINHNPKAPIFKHADFGIVGDVKDVVKAILEALAK